MSAPPLPPSFPLPAVHKALLPYIRPSSEVLEIRQLLTRHIQSLTTTPRISSAQGSSDEFSRFLDLELSRGDGVRRQYLSAMRDNIAARAEYQAALASLNTDTPDDAADDSTDDPLAPDDWKQAYMTVLQLRRQLARLSVLREGVTSLAEVTLDRPPGGLGGAYPHQGPQPPDEILPRTATAPDGIDPAQDTALTNSLVLALEKRIVSTHEQLLSETARLNTLSAQPLPEGADKRQALHATQTELIAWLDSALSLTPDDSEVLPDSPVKQPTPRGEQPTPEAVLATISDSYSAYLNTRTQLLALLTSPIPTPAPLPASDSQTAAETARLLAQRLDPTPPPPAPPVLRILAGAEHLLPLTHAQKSLLQTHNILSTSVSRRRIDLAAAFNDVHGDPVEAAQSVAGRVEQGWAQAQKQAQADTDKSRGMLFKAGETMAEVEELCGGRAEKRSKRAIPVRRSGSGIGTDRTEEREKKGLWGQLDGGVGVIGDGI
ncbi:hypothetical protein EDC01DRAFT_682511 [Geopyxis carbonaria]|nr:hypothetical protein EDC01DRAFT_682511 [Geopyxis carbonaria]